MSSRLGVFQVCVALSRIACIAFCVLAAFGIPQARNLLDDDIEQSGSTVYLPLQLCRPESIQINDQVLSIDYSEGVKQCITLGMLINACACSMVVSIIAVLVFIVVDARVRMTKGTNKYKGMVIGMGIFLCFILMQTAFTTAALSRQAAFYEKLYNDFMDATAPEYEAKMHGSLNILWSAAAAALLACILIGLESLYSFCMIPDQALARRNNQSLAMGKGDPSLTPNKTPELSQRQTLDEEVAARPAPTVVSPAASSPSHFSWVNLS